MTTLFKGMDILSSGMYAQRIRLNTTASNLANANTTRTEEGGAYRRRDPVFSPVPLSEGQDSFSQALSKVEVPEVRQSQGPLPQVYDPTHPDANAATGMVEMPDVNVVEEMVNMITAARSYEANVTAFETLKQMASRAMEIGR